MIAEVSCSLHQPGSHPSGTHCRETFVAQVATPNAASSTTTLLPKSPDESCLPNSFKLKAVPVTWLSCLSYPCLERIRSAKVHPNIRGCHSFEQRGRDELQNGLEAARSSWDSLTQLNPKESLCVPITAL